MCHNRKFEIFRKLVCTLLTFKIHTRDHCECFEPLWSVVAQLHDAHGLKLVLETRRSRAVPKSELEVTQLDYRFSPQTTPGRLWHTKRVPGTYRNYADTHQWVFDFLYAMPRDTKVTYHIWARPLLAPSMRKKCFRNRCGTRTYDPIMVFWYLVGIWYGISRSHMEAEVHKYGTFSASQ